MIKMSIKKIKENDKYKKCLANLLRTGKEEELRGKIQNFIKQGEGFTITKIRREDYKIVINRDGKFWEGLGFKEISIKSTKTSKEANKLIKLTKNMKGNIYYNCFTKKKLAFMIPTKETLIVSLHKGKKVSKRVDCYTIIIL